MDELDHYLGQISGHRPTLRTDLVKLADVADTYDAAAPDLLRVLRNVTTTGRTIIDSKAAARRSSPTSAGSPTPRPGAEDNGANLIRVGQVTEPVLRLLAVYSPELPCLIEGAAATRPARPHLRGQPGQAVHRVRHAAVPRLRPARPAGLRRGRPRAVVPGPAEPQVPSPPIASSRAATSTSTRRPHRCRRGSCRGLNRPGVDYSGSAGEQQVVNALLSERTGLSADTFGSLGSLMYGPLLREGVSR